MLFISILNIGNGKKHNEFRIYRNFRFNAFDIAVIDFQLRKQPHIHFNLEKAKEDLKVYNGLPLHWDASSGASRLRKLIRKADAFK